MSKAIWGKYDKKGAKVLLILEKIKFKVRKTHKSSNEDYFIFIKDVV